MTQANDNLALVAGGAGFIGSHLCRALLDRGHEVLCLDNLQTGAAVQPARPGGACRASTFIEADVVDALPTAVIAAGASHSPASTISPAPPRRRNIRPIPSIRCSPTWSARIICCGWPSEPARGSC